MKIFITGSGGYIGQRLGQVLINRGHRVHGYDLNDRNPFTLKGDIRDGRATYHAMAGADIVIHLAAIASTTAKPCDLNQSNVCGTINVLDSMVAHGIKNIIFASSAAVYNVNETHEREEWNASPDQAVITPYGASKYMGERLLDQYRLSYGIGYTAFRFFNVAGAGEDRETETHLIPNIIRCLKTGDVLQLRGMNTQRDYIHIADILTAHVKAIDYLQSEDHASAMNLCTGKATSNTELIQKLEGISGKELEVHVTARSQTDPGYLVGDNSRAKQQLGWYPEMDVNAILKSSWNWFNR